MEEKTEELTNRIIELEKELQNKITEYDNKINARYDEIQQEGGDAYIDAEYNRLYQERQTTINDLTSQINQLYSELEVNENAIEEEKKAEQDFNEDKEKRINEISRKIDARLQALYELGDSNVYLDEELANLRLELDKIKEEKFISPRELAEREQEEKIKQEEEKRNKEILAARKEYNEIKQEKQDLEQEIKVDEESLENNSLFKEREALKAEIENLQKKGKGQDDPEYKEYMNDIEKISAELEQLTAKIDEKKSRLEQFNIRMSELESQYGDKLVEQVQQVKQNDGLNQHQEEPIYQQEKANEEREIPSEEDLILDISNTSEYIYEMLSENDKKEIMQIDVYNIKDDNKYVKVLGLENNSYAYKFLLLAKLQEIIKERDLKLTNSQSQANDKEPKKPQKIQRENKQSPARPIIPQEQTQTRPTTSQVKPQAKPTTSQTKPKKEISFAYKVSSKGIFFNGEQQDEQALNEYAEKNDMESILKTELGEIEANNLLQYGDEYLILSILSNGQDEKANISETAKENLRNYSEALLKDVKSSKVNISYDLRGTTWFSKLIGKSKLSLDYAEYAKLLAFDNRNIADVKTGPITGLVYKVKDVIANMGVKRIGEGEKQEVEQTESKTQQDNTSKSWSLTPEQLEKANAPTPILEDRDSKESRETDIDR